MTRLEAIKARLAATSVGKWVWDGESDIDQWGESYPEESHVIVAGDGPICPYGVQNKDNADFIVKAHNDDVPWAIERIEELAETAREAKEHMEYAVTFLDPKHPQYELNRETISATLADLHMHAKLTGEALAKLDESEAT